MAKLQIRIVTNLMVNEFIAELLDSFLRNSITFLRFKHNTQNLLLFADEQRIDL